MELIRVEDLRKEFKVRKRNQDAGMLKDLFHRSYTTKKAVDGISFSIGAGEIVGYLGPNGAGKSTTIKMLSGILSPTSGEIISNGLRPYQDRKEYVKRIGVVFGQRTQLWWDIPVQESLDLMKYMYKIPEADFKRNMELFADILNIEEFAHIPVRQLSLGQRMRADLCASLLHNPDIIFLDEPTIGLDAVAKRNVRDFVREVNRERKTTIMLTTHDMADVEKLCSRVIVIDHGKKIYDGSLEKLRDIFGSTERLVVKLQNEIVDTTWYEAIGVEYVRKTEQGWRIKYDRGKLNSSEILAHLMRENQVLDFKLVETEVEDAIRAMYLAQEEGGGLQ